jgi:ATP-dependent RNA helicase RhlE
MEFLGPTGVGAHPQIQKFRRGVDVLVACPGRLLDLVGSGHASLSRIEILVLDEADRMLDMGFIHDIRRILKLLPQHRQNLLFSATYSNDIRKLARTVLQHPKNIDVSGGNRAVKTVRHVVHQVSRKQKPHLLIQLLRTDHPDRTLVFTRTKHGANRLTGQLLKFGVQAAAIHGNKSQTTRTKALNGLDIEQLPSVVNFNLPNVPLDYIHRIGRTGRAGKSGQAVSLVSAEEQPLLTAIEKVLNRPIPVECVVR